MKAVCSSQLAFSTAGGSITRLHARLRMVARGLTRCTGRVHEPGNLPAARAHRPATCLSDWTTTSGGIDGLGVSQREILVFAQPAGAPSRILSVTVPTLTCVGSAGERRRPVGRPSYQTGEFRESCRQVIPMSTKTANPITNALSDAVKAYLRLHYGHVILPELYDVFRTWHPSVTPSLLYEIIQGTLSDDSNKDTPPLPAWDAAAGQLYFAKYLVKEFRRPAQNQRRLLDEFERQEWRNEVRNPFNQGRIPFDVAAEALRNAAEALNDDHVSADLIRFGTRDNCSYVYWKAVCKSS